MLLEKLHILKRIFVQKSGFASNATRVRDKRSSGCDKPAYNRSDYVYVIAWGANAKQQTMLPIGVRVVIEGRLQSRKYEKRPRRLKSIRLTRFLRVLLCVSVVVTLLVFLVERLC